MFFRKRNEREVKIDEVMYIHRNGKKYKQVSYWDRGTRYSTLVDEDVKLPPVGGMIQKSKLTFKG